jgi:hypothetical protein
VDYDGRRPSDPETLESLRKGVASPRILISCRAVQDDCMNEAGWRAPRRVLAECVAEERVDRFRNHRERR